MGFILMEMVVVGHIKDMLREVALNLMEHLEGIMELVLSVLQLN